MKITDMTTDNKKTLRDINNGEVFEHERVLYLMTDFYNPATHKCGCAELKTGAFKMLSVELKVKPVLAEVIIMNDTD